MKIYRELHYDAMAIGPHDISGGISFLYSSLAQDTPWISGNILTTQGIPAFPPWKIIKKESFNIGVLGLTSPVPIADKHFKVVNWKEVLPGYVKELENKCDLLVLLSNLDDSENNMIAARFPDIHIIISANRKSGNIMPRLLHNSLVTQTHSRGKYLGILRIDWPESRIWNNSPRAMQVTGVIDSFGTYDADFKVLTTSLPESKEIRKILNQLKNEILEANKKRGHVSVSVSKDNHAGKTVNTSRITHLTGSASCQKCHPERYQQWNSTRHAQAYTTLLSQGQQFNLRCLPCHVTYEMKAVAEENTVNPQLLSLPESLHAVGCESCHGPGKLHVESNGAKDTFRVVEETICRNCHSLEMDKSFTFVSALSKVKCNPRSKEK